MDSKDSTPMQKEEKNELEERVPQSKNAPGMMRAAPSRVTATDFYGRSSVLSFRCRKGFIDTHCHLDYLFKKQNFNGTYAEYIQMHRSSYPVTYKGCVAVFCHPHTFHKRNTWQMYLSEEGVWGALGCHPHYAELYDDAAERYLEDAFLHPKVRALGEIGLDYSKRNNCSRATQHWVFRRQLKIALRKKLPLVIHCREANEDAMNIMKEILPKEYVIHLHCFTDSWEWAKKWLREFSNLYIGITNKVTYPSSIETHEVAKNIPIHRLLLETDAPHFEPENIPNIRHSHPGMAIYVAARISVLRDEPLEDIIRQTRYNTTIVYGI